MPAASFNSEVNSKSSFSRNALDVKETQECNRGNGCKYCEIMKLKKNVTLWKKDDAYRKTIKLDFRCDCLSDNIVYLFICKLGMNEQKIYKAL